MAPTSPQCSHPSRSPPTTTSSAPPPGSPASSTPSATAPREPASSWSTTSLLGPGTTPEAASVSAPDLDALRTVQAALESAFARAAERSGVELVAVSALSSEHALGSAEPWVTGLVPTRRGLAGSYHPNAVGMRAVADALAAVLG